MTNRTETASPPMTTTDNPPSPERLEDRTRRLGLYGLLAHWQELGDQPWVQTLIAHEEAERHRRSLERRIRTSKVGRFRPLVDFDWSWPKNIGRSDSFCCWARLLPRVKSALPW